MIGSLLSTERSCREGHRTCLPAGGGEHLPSGRGRYGAGVKVEVPQRVQETLRGRENAVSDKKRVQEVDTEEP